MGAALSHRNYRVLWLAALGSTIGTWMQSYAQSYLVFELTKSNFYLGLDTFLGQLPILLRMLIGGVIADRHDRRRLLRGSQYVQAFSALSLAPYYEALRTAQVDWQNPEQLRFVLKEGKKRQIRRMCEQVGLFVTGLKRVRIGRVNLGHLPVGQWRYLAAHESF